jgi:hypothetical protein
LSLIDSFRTNDDAFLCPFLVANLSQQLCELWRKFKQLSRNLNFFPSVPPSTEEHELRTQRIATRLFIFFLIVSLTILLLYTSLINVTRIVNVQTPNLAQYNQLYSTYSETLTCPCTQISINYRTFLPVDYTLHQVCTSIFVNQSWIDYLARHNGTIVFERDFRVTGSSAFQALRTFCRLISSTISDSLTQFHSKQYVGASVTPVELFQSEMKSSVDQFRLSMTKRFLLSLWMIRDTTQANALFSASGTNYQIIVVSNTYTLATFACTYDLCNCASSSTCIYPSSIYQYPSNALLFNLSGFYTGCFLIESLLQSTLQCFYDQVCIDHLLIYFSRSPSMNVLALDLSLPSNYSVNSTIKDLVNNLMIEQWNAPPIYENYYNACQPTHCIYSVETRNDVIYIVTTLFGIVGGLITVLKFILPRLVQIVRKKRENSRAATGKIKAGKFLHCFTSRISSFDYHCFQINREGCVDLMLV